MRKISNTMTNTQKREKERSKWLVLEEGGWHIVIPELDVKPHSVEDKGKKRDLAHANCPCGPKISYTEQMIVHNSFSDKMGLEISIKRNMRIDPNPSL